MDSQLDYLERLLSPADDSTGPAEFLYIVPLEGEPAFWELVGLRVEGLSRALLGAVRFQAQTRDRSRFARRSLASYLSSPPRSIGIDHSTYPADLVELRVPREGETFPDLLARLKSGQRTGSVHVDADLVELAWDFRPENPSTERPKRGQSPGECLLLRSREGHVLVGESTNLTTKLRSSRHFIALTGVAQWLPDRRFSLPTLVIHRRFLTMVSNLSDDRDSDAGKLPAPFARETLNPFHLLDPRLTVPDPPSA